MGVGSGGQGGMASPGFFVHGTNTVDRGLKVLLLFFGVFFPLPPPPPPPPPLEEA